jgi:hypothetical protein
VRTLGRVLLCFVALPLLPVAVGLMLATWVSESDVVWGGFICAATVAALTSGAIGYRPRRSPVAFVAYAAATGALAALSVGVLIALLIAIACGDSSDCL